MIKISKRLETVASFVKKGSHIVDIGTDHGYIPIWLVEQGVVDYAIAMDIGKGPLERAREHIALYQLDTKIETRLSDGLKELKEGEVDTAIIAGMGGKLILQILKEGSHMWNTISMFIVSPQSDLDVFRQEICQMGLVIEDETMVVEEGKFYTIMVLKKGTMNQQQEYEYKYGSKLIEKKHPVLLEFLEKEFHQLVEIQQQVAKQDTRGAQIRLEQLTCAIRYNREAYDEMQ